MPITTGSFYSITEWDDTRYVVKIVAQSGDDLVMEYEDGLTQRVTRQYFITGLHALCVRKARLAN